MTLLPILYLAAALVAIATAYSIWQVRRAKADQRQREARLSSFVPANTSRFSPSAIRPSTRPVARPR